MRVIYTHRWLLALFTPGIKRVFFRVNISIPGSKHVSVNVSKKRSTTLHPPTTCGFYRLQLQTKCSLKRRKSDLFCAVCLRVCAALLSLVMAALTRVHQQVSPFAQILGGCCLFFFVSQLHLLTCIKNYWNNSFIIFIEINKSLQSL